MHTIQLCGAVTRVHFIGIGGISMSGLAEALLQDGYRVSGSDETDSAETQRLISLGADITVGNNAANIDAGIDLAVYTAAVKPDNPEYRAAVEKGVPLIDRARLLGLIAKHFPRAVCVSGSHGKTGTTAMIAEACLAAGLDPTVAVGGYMGEGYNFRRGASPHFILEACEYFDSFLQFSPYVGVILNIDNDHMDYFGDMARLIDSFVQFARNIQPGGALVVNGGVPDLARITEGLPCRVFTFGADGADYAARDIRYDTEGRASFDIMENGAYLARTALRIPGAHIATNALAAAAVCRVLGMSPDDTARGLGAARGVKRRFEYKGRFNGADVIDDYAHHPTEIKASLAAMKAARTRNSGRVICVFQPHTYSRTAYLIEDFALSFKNADRVLLLPIYASREQFGASPGSTGVTSYHLADKIRAAGQDARGAADFDEAEAMLRETVIPGDLLITMGAGDVYLLGERLISPLLRT